MDRERKPQKIGWNLRKTRIFLGPIKTWEDEIEEKFLKKSPKIDKIVFSTINVRHLFLLLLFSIIIFWWMNGCHDDNRVICPPSCLWRRWSFLWASSKDATSIIVRVSKIIQLLFFSRNWIVASRIQLNDNFFQRILNSSYWQLESFLPKMLLLLSSGFPRFSAAFFSREIELLPREFNFNNNFFQRILNSSYWMIWQLKSFLPKMLLLLSSGFPRFSAALFFLEKLNCCFEN